MPQTTAEFVLSREQRTSALSGDAASTLHFHMSRVAARYAAMSALMQLATTQNTTERNERAILGPDAGQAPPQIYFGGLRIAGGGEVGQ
ncbi:MAG: hypothetical protein FJ037_08285 [Chloroflexi bacterium]|nr:hypothetical protein [Chloroflexota bacterium]